MALATTGHWRSACHLGSLLAELGRQDEAAELFEAAHDAQADELGPDHVDTRASAARLAHARELEAYASPPRGRRFWRATDGSVRSGRPTPPRASSTPQRPPPPRRPTPPASAPKVSVAPWSDGSAASFWPSRARSVKTSAAS